jgi:hypothetical protein
MERLFSKVEDPEDVEFPVFFAVCREFLRDRFDPELPAPPRSLN